jgi:hypothetical protein
VRVARDWSVTAPTTITSTAAAASPGRAQSAIVCHQWAAVRAGRAAPAITAATMRPSRSSQYRSAGAA